MSLRARMGLAAGVAVALAVIAVAASAYEGTRSELRNQVDQSLQNIARPIVGRAHGGPGPQQAGPAGLPQNGTFSGRGEGHDCDNGTGIDLSEAPGLGAAAGLRQFIAPSGRICLAPGGATLPVDARATALAAQTTLPFTGENVLLVIFVGLLLSGGGLALAARLRTSSHRQK